MSCQIKRLNAFQGYCEIIERRLTRKDSSIKNNKVSPLVLDSIIEENIINQKKGIAKSNLSPCRTIINN